MGSGIITFRNQLWDALIEFLEQLKEYPSFEVMDNGKLKTRIDYVYNRALEKMRLDKSDMDLISRTFIYLNEKDISSELVEYMNENKELGHKCTTTRDGQKIIKECEAIVTQRKREEEIRKRYEEAKAIADKAAEEKRIYEETQNRIMSNYEESQRELAELEELLKSEQAAEDSKEPEKVTEEDKENKNEKSE